jgi:hypothetical protein
MLSFAPNPIISHSFHENKDCYIQFFLFPFCYERETLSSKYEEGAEIEVVWEQISEANSWKWMRLCNGPPFPTSWKCTEAWRQMARHLKYDLWFPSSSLLFWCTELGVILVNDRSHKPFWAIDLPVFFSLDSCTVYVLCSTAVPHILSTFSLLAGYFY